MSIYDIAEILRCPVCEQGIFIHDDRCECTSCKKTFPIIVGIPDFRLTLNQQRRASEQQHIDIILNKYDKLNFNDIMKDFIARTTDPGLLDLDTQYMLGWKSRGAKQLAKIKALFQKQASWGQFVENSKHGIYIDVGCGKGAMLATMASRFRFAIGIDRSMTYLILAKKLAQEIGLENVVLMAGENESMPFVDDCVDFITAIDVIEHVGDQEKGLNEDFRILKSGKHFFLNSPNRYNLFTLEDHVQVWGVGFMPRSFMESYVYMVSKRKYTGIRLLSYFELSRLLKQHSRKLNIEGIILPDEHRDLSKKERILKQYPALHFILNHVFKLFIPSYNALAQK